MGHIEKRVRARPDGSPYFAGWRARYREPNGRERSRTFPRKADAARWLAGMEGDLVQGRYIDPDGGKQLFGDYAEKWLAAQVFRATTAAKVESHLRLHMQPHFGGRPLGAIRNPRCRPGSRGCRPGWRQRLSR